MLNAKHRSGRELAFKLLFELDLGGADISEVFDVAFESAKTTQDAWRFATELARGAWNKRVEIDGYIERYAAGWKLERMANADRNLLRLAIFEILYRDEIPQKVSINEAVELAKEYSTAESPRFINGILGNFVRDREATKSDT